MIRFDDKVAFITGGTSGIGRAAAERLATLGAEVAIAGGIDKSLATLLIRSRIAAARRSPSRAT